MIVAVVSGTNGKALAWISVDPTCTPAVTWTRTVVAFGGRNTDDGTVAIPGLSELRLIFTPLTVAAEMTRLSFFPVPGLRLTMFGTKLIFALTGTVVLAEIYPVAVAVIV